VAKCSRFGWLFATDCVGKALCLIEKLSLFHDLVLGRRIWRSVHISPALCEAWLCGLVHKRR
jgi:hypothetical protein